ncbi:hypothetical protein P5P86_07315 [Nocardioides sp. BP30]|uniref:hypothetical protein n=1 Tax=Nocardioides sp. BP30 TaxID=3036374 RepID=UPI0024688F94|nr:hypothetical protein [Nocardioides sp. BP30]WGL53633.1 hypothetical protein P5P86_07315 [Nocardioides sp. BP30]
MLPYRSSALLASAALVLGAAFVPASAFADDTTPDPTPTPTPAPAFTNADLVAALTADEAPTAAAAKAGWVSQGSVKDDGFSTEGFKAIYAVNAASEDYTSAGSAVEVEHSGTYFTLSVLGPRHKTKQALKAIRKPHATWVFMPEKSLDLRDLQGDSSIAHLAPDAMLKGIVDPTQTTLTGTPTTTTAADGSTTYGFSQTDLSGSGDSGTETVTVNRGGVVTAFTYTDPSDAGSVHYSYGAQHVTLPAAKRTVTFKQYLEGTILADLPREVKQSATFLAKQLTHAYRKHGVKVATVRSVAKRFAKFTNSIAGAKIFSTAPVSGGVRLTGTNHFTHKHVSYTVKVSGKRAVAHKA